MKLRLRLPARRHLAVVLGALAVLLGPAVTPAQAGTWDIHTYSSIQNVNSKKCLEVADWRTDWGAPVRQWSCTGGDNQKWVLVGDTDRSDIQYLRNVHSGLCVDITGWNSGNGAPAEQWPCNQQGNQTWVNTAGNPRILLTDGVTFVYNMCLEIADWRVDDGAPARIWSCHYGANQQWQFNG